MIKQLRVLVLLSLFFSYQAYSQGDTCAAATALTVNASCTYTTYTNATATDSGEADPGCALYGGADVWFSIVVPASGSLIIDSDTGVITDSGMALYTGACGALTLYECDDDDSPNGLMSYINATGLTPGSTVYVRFWEFGGDNNGTFDICVTEPPPPPANDDCSNAIELAVDYTCNFVTYTNESATDSGIADPGCALYSGGDVWFYVDVPASGELTIDMDTGVMIDSGLAIYSGSCGALTLIECDDDDSANGLMSSITLTGQTPGDILYIRVWEYGNNNNGSFDICASTVIPPGTNGVSICPGDPSEPLTTDLSCVSAGTTIPYGLQINGALDEFGSPPLHGTALQPMIFIQSTDPCAFDATDTANYTYHDFQVTVSGTYVFAMDTPVPYFDGMGYIVVNDGLHHLSNDISPV